MASTAPVQIDRQRIAELTDKEEQRLEAATPKSFELYKRAVQHMPMGVASTYHARDPYPVYFTHGKGSKIYTIDGQEISDFHNGYGCMVQGHAHPVIVEAIQKRAPLGTQFGLPTEDAHHHGRAPRRRLQAAQVALRELRLRGHDGRHPRRPRLHRPRAHRQDVRLLPRPSRLRHGLDRRRRTSATIGPRDNYKSISYGAGIPQSSIDLTDPGAVQRPREHGQAHRARWSPRAARRPPSSWSPP